MSAIPENLRYAKTHEWAKQEGDHIVLGITVHAQELLGDLVYVELPAPGKVVKAGEEVSVVESVKAASDVYAPMSGEVIEVNQALATQPELINQDAYAAWICKIKPSDSHEWSALLTAQGYQQIIDEESH